MDFHPYTPFDSNSAQNKVWEWVKEAFREDEGVAYYRYPIFKSGGQLHREPDILLLHRELGIWVIECKGFHINNICNIQGHSWITQNWHTESEAPVAQAEDQMFAIQNKLTSHRETRGLMSFHFRVALPFVRQEEWQDKGFCNNAVVNDSVLVYEELTPAALRKKLTAAAHYHPQRPLNNTQWEVVKTVLGGTLPSKQLHNVPSGTPSDNPIRVIRAIESRMKSLDSEQQKIAFEVPPGPQRIRGLAGTGKTVLFAKRIAKMHASNPDWRLAFVFFTRSLYDQIIELIDLYYREMTDEEPNWQKIKVLHAWGAKDRDGFYRSLSLASGCRPLSVRDVEDKIGRSSPNTAFQFVCEYLEQAVPNVPCLYDAILIDEGQDLPAAFYRLALNSLSAPKRLYWAYDEAQGIGSLIVPEPKNIFGSNPDGSPVVDLGGNKLPDGAQSGSFYEGGILKARVMNACYRTPRQLLMTAHAINMGLFRDGGALQGVTKRKDWEKLGYEIIQGDFKNTSVKSGQLVEITRPLKSSPHIVDQPNFEAKEGLGDIFTLKPFSSETEEISWVAQQVANDIKEGFDPWDILITAIAGDGEKDYFFTLQKSLDRYGIDSIIAGTNASPDIFRMDGCITIAPIFRTKGNEAWKVYATRFQYTTKPLLWKDEVELNKRNEAFVALTRARVWCVITGIESPIFDELRLAKEQYPIFKFPAFSSRSLERINSEDEVDEADEVDGV